jgi:hypothetical protein
MGNFRLGRARHGHASSSSFSDRAADRTNPGTYARANLGTRATGAVRTDSGAANTSPARLQESLSRINPSRFSRGATSPSLPGKARAALSGDQDRERTRGYSERRPPLQKHCFNHDDTRLRLLVIKSETSRSASSHRIYWTIAENRPVRSQSARLPIAHRPAHCRCECALEFAATNAPR